MVFIGLPLLLVLGIVLGISVFAHRHAVATAGGTGATAHHLTPTSRIGAWSLWVLLAAAVAQLGLSTVVVWAGAPFGALSSAMAILAMARQHDRSPLLRLAVLIGGFVAAFPLLFWWLG